MTRVFARGDFLADWNLLDRLFFLKDDLGVFARGDFLADWNLTTYSCSENWLFNVFARGDFLADWNETGRYIEVFLNIAFIEYLLEATF